MGQSHGSRAGKSMFYHIWSDEDSFLHQLFWFEQKGTGSKLRNYVSGSIVSLTQFWLIAIELGYFAGDILQGFFEDIACQQIFWCAWTCGLSSKY